MESVVTNRCRDNRPPPVKQTIRSVLIVRGAWGEIHEPAWNRALNEIGLRSRVFDSHARLRKGILGRIEQRLLWGPDLSKVNRELIQTVKQSKPDVTLLYQGHHYWAETIQELAGHTFVVGYHNDDLLGPRKHLLRYRHLNRALPFYHGYHVYRDCNLKSLAQAGMKNAAVLMPYFIPWLDYPRTLSSGDHQRFDCDLVFAGHWEDDRRVECLSAAVRKGIHVRLYGQRRYWGPAIPRNVRNRLEHFPHLYGEEYRKALCGSRIAACFLSKWNRDQYTRRVFEIPACGVFLLAERTAVMQQLYQEGKEAEYFSSPEEFVDKARFYLRNPDARKRIAEAGHKRATTCGYDIYSRMRRWLEDVQNWSNQSASEEVGRNSGTSACSKGGSLMPILADAFYDNAYHSRRHAKMIADDEYFWARAEASSRLYFTEEERKKAILDYGCGVGQGIAALPNAAGWDASSEAREICRQRKLNVYEELSDVPKKAWDIVFCRHVLEHLESPLDALRKMRELLAEGGELYLVLPKEKHGPAPFTPDIDQHLYCWNYRTANNLLLRAGFEPYVNRDCYVLGYRALLPIRRLFGRAVYYWGCRLVGYLKRNPELIIRARPVNGYPPEYGPWSFRD